MKFPSFYYNTVEKKITALRVNFFQKREKNKTEDAPAAADASGKGDGEEVFFVPYLPIASLKPGFYQPRRDFADGALLALADSIRLHGLLHPLTVRPLEGGREGYAVISGERRLRALEILGKKTAPCRILDVSAEEAAALSLIENLHREDLNLFELTDAEERLGSIAGQFPSETGTQLLASLLSQPVSALQKRQGLSVFTARERELILAADLPAEAVTKLAEIRESEHRLAILRELCRQYAQVESVEAWVSSLLSACETAAKISGAKKKLVLQDLRLFENSIDRAVRTVKDAGVDAIKRQEDLPDRHRIIIDLPKARDREETVPLREKDSRRIAVG